LKQINSYNLKVKESNLSLKVKTILKEAEEAKGVKMNQIMKKKKRQFTKRPQKIADVSG
jgi:hypothetical protein